MILLFMKEVFVKDIFEYWVFPMMLHSAALGKVYHRFSWKVKATQSCLTLCNPMDCVVHGILQARILDRAAFPFCRGCSQPRDWTRVSRIEGGFFTSWATGKPKNAGEGSLSLLQRIFLTQESNWGLLHCKQTLYQLSYQGSRSKKGCRKANICSV